MDIAVEVTAAVCCGGSFPSPGTVKGGLDIEVGVSDFGGCCWGVLGCPLDVSSEGFCKPGETSVVVVEDREVLSGNEAAADETFFVTTPRSGASVSLVVETSTSASVGAARLCLSSSEVDIGVAFFCVVTGTSLLGEGLGLIMGRPGGSEAPSALCIWQFRQSHSFS